MAHRTSLDDAVQRLQAALDAFETAVQRRRAGEGPLQELEEDLHRLALDRARLARDLDEMSARAADLQGVTARVGDALDQAIAEVEAILTEEG